MRVVSVGSININLSVTGNAYLVIHGSGLPFKRYLKVELQIDIVNRKWIIGVCVCVCVCV